MKFMSEEVFYRTINKMIRDSSTLSLFVTYLGFVSVAHIVTKEGINLKLSLYCCVEDYNKSDDLPACE